MAAAEVIVEREPSIAQVRAVAAHIPELDGVRGIAILLVLICHSALWLPQSTLRSVLIEGKIGVDLFFVLSGFLITGILLDAPRRPRALRSFYIRRGLRIWPLYFAVLLVAFVLVRRMVPPHISAWAYVFLIQNFLYVANTGPLLDPMWSLAVEEQFYLVWPWIALRVKRETVLKICGMVLVLSPVVRWAFRIGGAGEEFIYANTLCRMDGIAMGGAIAAWVRNRQPGRVSSGQVSKAALVAGVAGSTLCFAFSKSAFSSAFGFSFIALAFGGVLSGVLSVQGTRSPLAVVLGSSALRGMGRISYALYLFNLPIYTVMHGRMAGAVLAHVPVLHPELMRALAGNVLSIVAGISSWKLYESRVLRLKSRWAAG